MTFKEELEAVLTQQLKTLIDLKDITEEKTQVLIDEDLETLERITRVEQELINRVGTLEVERERLLDSWGLKTNTSLSIIISNLPEDEKEDIGKLGEELYKIIEIIDEKNKLNSQLLADNIDWVEFNLNLLTSVQTPSTYSKGEGNMKSNNSLFDRKV
ncbi:flagellar protein FlgN [Anaerosalibacter sp. Marseille-P3206]|uniref:flagellar protein FlgN n=1 Tax=Anaerosalibacter sp. Marseille-P3206 TaxID=1871005 RepID=UPI0013562A85|nr:flagellar protein FlgN [Anaerosalibacter sp. Marseille-P3206]